MAKTTRGTPIKKIPNWRGTCPSCGRTRVKLLWNKMIQGNAAKVCKRCAASR